MGLFTDICNIALGVYLGADPITDYSTGTGMNARRCRQIFPTVLDECIEEHPWSFAKKRFPLNYSTETRAGYQYTYIRPSDCVLERALYREDRASKPVEYEVMSNDAGTGDLICTNESGAILEYTYRVTENDSVKLPAYFRKVVALNLAAALAMVIKKGDGARKKAQEYQTDYAFEMKRAKRKDHKRKVNTTEPDCEFLTSRVR